MYTEIPLSKILKELIWGIAIPVVLIVISFSNFNSEWIFTGALIAAFLIIYFNSKKLFEKIDLHLNFSFGPNVIDYVVRNTKRMLTITIWLAIAACLYASTGPNYLSVVTAIVAFAFYVTACFLFMTGYTKAYNKKADLIKYYAEQVAKNFKAYLPINEVTRTIGAFENGEIVIRFDYPTGGRLLPETFTLFMKLQNELLVLLNGKGSIYKIGQKVNVGNIKGIFFKPDKFVDVFQQDLGMALIKNVAEKIAAK